MKKYLITGLLIWIPLAITIWVLELIVSTMDQSLLLLPPQYQPQVLFGRQIPGLGALLTVVVVFVTGLLASNILGQRLLLFWEYLLGRIPVVKTIYSGVKQVSDTLFAPGGQAFSQALLVLYPREGHGLREEKHLIDRLNRVIAWYDAHLKPPRPSTQP